MRTPLVSVSGKGIPWWLILLATVLVSALPAARVRAQEAAPIPEKALAGAPTGWLEQVQRRIAASEYEVTWQSRTHLSDLDASWQAPNRAHGFRTYFTESGIRVIRRAEEDPSWEWGLDLIGYGRGGEVWPVAAASLRPSGNRIQYARRGISEWYVNDPKGLEQGFTLLSRPEEEAAASGVEAEATAAPRGARDGLLDFDRRGSLVFVQLALKGTLDPVFSTDGLAIDFRTGGGVNVVHFAGLRVTDASGRELPAWMEGASAIGGRAIRIAFDDADAAYPVTVDPLATSPAWTAESDQAGANLGCAVSTAGDVNGDGYSDVIVGAHLFDNGETDEGRAYVYHGSASGLSAAPAWTAESDQGDAQFGHSVSTAGDVNGDGYSDVIVGAYQYDNGQENEGRAYIYHGSASGLSGPPAWTAEGNQVGVWFGCAVSTAGDVNGDGYSDVIVGASVDFNGEGGEGRAYVYHGSASGLSASASWTAESDQINARFGASVSTAGDVNGDGYSDVIVGAFFYDNGETDEGRAYVYHGSAAGLSSAIAWMMENGQADSYVSSVGTAGDVNGDGYSDVIVGASSYDGGEGSAGRACAFLGSAAGLSMVPAWTAVSDQEWSYFGVSVSTTGDVNGDGYSDVIVGAYLYDNGETDEGRAYVYHGSASGLSEVEGWTAEGDQASAQFGCSVSTAGDVNGDGYADVIVGAWMYDNGQTDEGRAYAYSGSSAGLSATATWTAESDQESSHFGNSVSTAGDVNGDGYSDVIVGALDYDYGQTNEGRAYVYHGSAAGLSAAAAWTAESEQGAAYFGSSASTAGDVNGDGYSDVIVGAYGYDGGQTNEGRAYVYHGSAAGLSAAAAWTAESDQASALFGGSVGTAGDVNGDGYSDVIVGAFQYENGEATEGRVYVYHGSAAGLSASAAWTAEGDQAEAWLGHSAATAGDVDGDGYSDVVVGAAGYDNGETAEGRAYVYHGSASGLSAAPAWTAECGSAYCLFGDSVSTAGDVNGDGYSDVVVGARGYTSAEDEEGRAYVYHGSASGLGATAAWTAEPDQAGAHFGRRVATAGDVNGDGYSDVIVGAEGYENGQTDEGRAFLYYGNGGPGLSLRPQQRRADDAAPIVQGGRSHAPGEFRLAGLGRSPFGRAQAKLEWEVKPFGKFLDGTGTARSTEWVDTGTSGAAWNELVSDLEPGRYHWRVRLHYEAASSPFQAKGPWFAVPWNGSEETDLSVAPFIGGFVWNDQDRDGIRDTGEPGLWQLSVRLVDAVGTVVKSVFTDSAGAYRFEVAPSGSYRVRFTLPDGWMFTLQDEGVDDSLDSDADTVTGETALVSPPYQASDTESWSAGMLEEGPCFAPDEPVYLYSVRLDANDWAILDFQDPNQPEQVTGYNVYRSSDPGAPWPWPLVGSNVVDMDEATLNLQWVDQSGDPGSWYYEVIAYNAICDVEGPR